MTSEKPQWFEWTVFMERAMSQKYGSATARWRLSNGRVLTTLAADKPEIKPFVDMSGTEKAHGVLKAYRGPRLRIWGKFKWKARTLRLGQPPAIVRCTAI